MEQSSAFKTDRFYEEAQFETSSAFGLQAPDILGLQRQSSLRGPLRGLMHQASRPPQSVASVNITNLEDSEGMVRAYKKKKGELEELKERYYHLETDCFTERQRSRLLEEDVSKLRASLARAEKVAKDAQLKDSRRDTEVLARQLHLKTQEAAAYQEELGH